jgi:hypothetical protein
MSGELELMLEREYQAAPPARRRRQDDPEHLSAIWDELLKRFPAGDERGYQSRKFFLGLWISLLTPAQARELYERLKVRRRHDDLSRAFHHALATPTRQMMLHILQLTAQGQSPDDEALRRILFPYRYRSAREFEERQVGGAPDPRIQGICRAAGQLAGRLREDMQRARGQPDPLRRRYTLQRIQRRGATWINRVSGQLAPILGQFAPDELDRLVGCLARVEHAIGLETAPFRRLKAAARARLGP